MPCRSYFANAAKTMIPFLKAKDAVQHFLNAVTPNDVVLLWSSRRFVAVMAVRAQSAAR
jgi:hypothetical protein